MRTLINHDPFTVMQKEEFWRDYGRWPCSWIACPDAGQPPFVTAYRLSFSIDQPERIRIHVAADERYDLFLDGDMIGRGNERGAPDQWFFETYDLPLEPGIHRLVARVWSLGDQAAQAQMSVHAGFLLAAEGKWTRVLGTGLARWETKPLAGYTFIPPGPAHWRGARIKVDGKFFPWGFERGEGTGWKPAAVLNRAIGRLTDWEFHREHILRPATLPPLLNREIKSGIIRFVGDVDLFETHRQPIHSSENKPDACKQWTAFFSGQAPVTVPENTTIRALIDLNNYYCAYPELILSGGSGGLVRISFAEALYTEPDPSSPKGNRDAIEGRYFIGISDIFQPDGGKGRHFDTLWWQAGRYVEILVNTGSEPLTLEQLVLRETRYPLEMESEFTASHPQLVEGIPLLIRGLQMCSNETFFDCPYYEELQYAGDTRLEILVTYMMTRDDRLPRKALRMFDASRLASGLTQSRYPSRVMQIIAPFALWWVMMVRDYAYWRNDLAFIRQLIPGVRATVDGFQRFMGADGLLYGPEGWNTMDWVPEWGQDAGVPPDGHAGPSGLLNWQLVFALLQLADLEDRLGEPLFAEQFRQRALALRKCALETFWDPARGLLADDRLHQHFSEHTQCMALLSEELFPGLLGQSLRDRLASELLSDPDIQRTTIYFSHYLFETYRYIGRVDRLLERMQLWFTLVEQGFKTPVEMPEPSRSDCHAWGSHPLFHYFATILGIRPVGLGFNQVVIAPQLGSLQSAAGRLVHPSGGMIEVSFYIKDGQLKGRVHLPEGVSGRVICNGISSEIKAQETWMCG